LTLAGLALACSAANAQGWMPVKGSQIFPLFAGRELGDGAHFAYQFASDRSFAGTEMGKDVQGRWRVDGERMCWKWTRPASAEECYEVQRNGVELRLLRDGYEAWSGQLGPAR
jgi:hypothetical protein